MSKLKCVLALIITTNLQICFSTLPLAMHETGTKCFGQYDIEYTVLNLNCPENSVIAITHIKVGAKRTSSNCPEIFNKTIHNSSCCQQAEDDCVFTFDTSFNHRYHVECNGRRRCSMQAQHVLSSSKCTELYLETTSYMSAEYFCIPEMDIGMFCSAEETVNDRALYLWNSEFPGVIAGGSGTECGCSVEVDNCEADINVFSIQRNLTKEREWTACIPEQTLTITGSDTGQSLVWTCHDNTLFTMSNIVTSTYLTVTLNNTRTGNGGNFWLAFQASKSANITLRCPSQRQQFCLDTTTTTAISTPTVNTTTSISPTPTANTTTSTSPTPTVNTTTSTSPKPTVKTTTSTSPTPTVNTTTSTSPKPTVNTTTSTSPTLTVNTTTSTSPTPTVNSTTSTSPKPTVNTTTSTSPTPDPPKKLNLWVLIGGSTGGVIFLIIVIAVIAKCRRPQTKRDNNGTQELVTPYATVYAPHDQRLDNIPRHVDHRMSTSTYISPIHDHGYASIRGIDAPRLNEPVQNRNQPKQRMQACRGFAHIRNETF